MGKHTVAVGKYEKPLESVRNVVTLCGGLDRIQSGAKVVIKPNIVYWTKEVAFPKWGVITTSRVIEDAVVLLKERGIDDITIAEGMVVTDPKDKETARHAFETLGYGVAQGTLRHQNTGRYGLARSKRWKSTTGSFCASTKKASRATASSTSPY